jgi:N-acetyl-gamma-glutamyl-phosphate reductase
MLRCAVVGATGYTGMELIKILLRHSGVAIAALTTRQQESIPVHQLIPNLVCKTDLVIRPYTVQELNQAADVVFLCLPHTEAMESAAQFRRAGKTVIDLSADLRLRDAKTYERWYGEKHTQPVLLKHAVYGLPEVNRKRIAQADLIANPGCYPTAAILALYPLVQQKLVDLESIIIDAKSGVSGAGKKAKASTHFCEVTENFSAYKVNSHQHTPEIEQCLSGAAGRKMRVTFTPHLLPLERGILATVYAKRKPSVSPQRILDAFAKSYKNEPFIRLHPKGSFPSLRHVRYTNYCDLGIEADSRSKQVIVIGAIDNLIKGASGQAVQNMNIRFDFPEEEGLN